MRPAGWLLLLAVPAVGDTTFFSLLPPPDSGLSPAAERRALLVAGPGLIEVPVRLDLLDRPGGLAQADEAVAEILAAGRQPWLRLSFGLATSRGLPDGRVVVTDEPEGLAASVFAGGADLAGYNAEINPANPLARRAAALAERYDGDGRDDAPGRPIVRWHELTAPAFTDGFAWPGGAAAVARALTVYRAAARQADGNVRVGLDPGGLPALEALLELPRSPVGNQADFITFAAGEATTSDGAWLGPDGLATIAGDIRAAFDRREQYAPRLRCRRVAVPAGADDRLQRAAAAKALIVAAAEGLLGCGLPAWDADPSTVGLIGDVRGLPDDGRGWRRRDSFLAAATACRLLGDALASGDAWLTEPLFLGREARGYRFETGDGLELVVAWALDLTGDAERRATVHLPISPGSQVARCGWEFSRLGRPDDQLRAGDDGLAAELGIDPEYFLIGPVPRIAPLPEVEPAPVRPWRLSASDDPGGAALALDGRLETAWRSAGGARRWWHIALDDPLPADRARLWVGPGSARGVVVQVSADGAVWRDLGRAGLPAGGGWVEVGFGVAQSAHWWRLLFELPPGEPLSLGEVELGDMTSRAGR